jgi:hypothetical protein
MRDRRIETATIARGAIDDPEPPEFDEYELRKVMRANGRRRARTRDIGAIRARLQSSADGHVALAAAQVAGRRPDERISDSDYKSFRRSVERAIHELDQEERLAEFEHHATVLHEPGPYAPDSPNSYYADLARAATARLAPDMPIMLGARSSDVD